MLRRLLITALAAGVAAGLLLTLVQQLRVTPLIHQAERYELAAQGSAKGTQDSVSDAQGSAEGTQDSVSVAQGSAEGTQGSAKGTQDSLTTAPGSTSGDSEQQLTFQQTAAGRFFVTMAVNVLAGVGFGLLLAAAFALHGRETSFYRGVIWGIAGYTAFVAAPALGLPPELPGAVAAELQARQLWWLGTVGATLAALSLIFLSRRLWLVFIGGFLAALPHAIGAPHPGPGRLGPFPEGLATEFIYASLATSLVFWLMLGGAAGWLYQRLSRPPGSSID